MARAVDTVAAPGSPPSVEDPLASYSVRAAQVGTDITIPGRIHEAGVREVALALGAEEDEDVDAWELLRRAIAPLGVQELGERLLDAVLLQPPIPAYCETLLRRMQDPASPPWVDYEVEGDRFQLWYCHHLVHRVLPDQWPAPALTKVRLEVTALDPSARPPGRRSTSRDRTAFAARLLVARGGENPLARGHDGQDVEWAFDAVWGAEVGNWDKLDEAAIAALPSPPPEGFAPFRVTLEVWMPPQWAGDLAEGDAWAAVVG